MKLQETGIGVDACSTIVRVSDERPERIIGSGTGSPASPKERVVKNPPDQDYVRMMEERYGIREEGIF